MSPNRNLLWARVVLDELARGGVRDMCLSPGSRSAPLAFALPHVPALRTTVHTDERSGGFVALGLAKATHRPVALVCTSGTAVANFFPAVVEASQSGVPLVVLTADRPPELRGTGANQTIDQERIFGTYARAFADAGLPEATPQALRGIRASVARLVARSRAGPPGPVHLNLPFREPLDPTPIPGDVPPDLAERDPEAVHGRRDGAPFVDERMEDPAPDAIVVERVASWLSLPRGLLVAGPTAEADEAPEILGLARQTGWPVLADPLSGLRSAEAHGCVVVTAYDAFLGHGPTRDRLRPDVVVRLGGAPTSKSLLSYLAAHGDVPQVTVNVLGHTWDVAGDVHVALRSPVSRALRVLMGNEPKVRAAGSDPAWSVAWEQLDEAATRFLGDAVSTLEFEGAVVARVASAVPPGHQVFVSNSLPVRDLDRFAHAPRFPRRVLGNRGASGIDGILSSAVGAALSGAPTTVILGDLSFLHDMSGLLTACRLRVPLTVVLINNRGGGIFELLPAARHGDPCEEFLVAPHTHDLEALARAAGASVHASDRAEEIARMSGEPVDGVRVLEYRSERKHNARVRQELESELALGLDHAWEALRAR